MSEAITWTNEKRRLRELIPWEINPATIDKAEAKRLEESLDEFGQVETIAISPTNEIYDGHQRRVVWGASKKYGPDYVVDVRVSSRPLTEQERKKLVIYLRKGAVGHFDFDILANNWDTEDLLDWGFGEKELQFDMPPAQPEKTEPETIPEQYMILIECEDEQTQAELLDRFNVEGLKCRALIS
jgi:ParB-like chromosome segregation protein Spo0J